MLESKFFTTVAVLTLLCLGAIVAMQVSEGMVFGLFQ